MKAEELMIGNWLSYNGKPYRVTQITLIDGGINDIHYMLENGKRDCGYPIVLTPKIMKKSGFRTGGCDFIYIDKDPDIVIDMFEPNNPKYTKSKEEYMNEVGVSLLQSNYVFGPLDAAIIIKAYYVHQLQNILRLCGIDKEILI